MKHTTVIIRTKKMPSAVNLGEEVLSGIVQVAEHLQGSIIAADTGCIESLRWSGAMPLLLRDFNVSNIVSASDLLTCASPQDLRRFLLVQEHETIDHVVFFLSGFLWDYETAFKKLLTLNIIHRVTICSSLSESAHECYDFYKLRPSTALDATEKVEEMHFDAFEAELRKTIPFLPVNPHAEEHETLTDDWEWHPPTPQIIQVRVIHVPLPIVPLLSSTTDRAEPSVFVLSHPSCAKAFPLLRHQIYPDTPPSYCHVNDVRPEQIPSAIRRSMRLVAYVLAETMMHARLDVQDRIFAIGATSRKIGHTFRRIVNEAQADTSSQAEEQQVASLVIIDRTADLTSPCAFGNSLLDRILALIPQTPAVLALNEHNGLDTHATRQAHVTEICPLHACEPISFSLCGDSRKYHVSSFVSQIPWKGGATLCHPTLSRPRNVFRSLAFRPAKLALRDLDKRLQAIEQTLVQQNQIQKAAMTRRPGEKVRGRDVVWRRICKILEAGEPRNREHSSLIELGIIVLETLERMDCCQTRWDACRQRIVRQLELCQQGKSEWILVEVADEMQRESMDNHEVVCSLQERLTVLVHAFACTADTLLDKCTIALIKQALCKTLLQAVRTDPVSVQLALPELYAQVVPYMGTIGHLSTEVESRKDDWEWNEDQRSDMSLEAITERIEAYGQDMMKVLEDCKQQCAKQSVRGDNLQENASTRSLLAELCNSLLNPLQLSRVKLEHIVDASEQLTRAGIDLLKSGFSKFGFDVGGNSTSGQRRSSNCQLLSEANVLVVFVVGGITFEEIQDVYDALKDNTSYQVVLGGTSITNHEMLLKKLFTFNPSEEKK
ncbi:hypothetical protein CCR75_004884 [Bremia lactucae]|uniref:Sec1 family domain-containing protein 2 n=1 Tax=Bremia lactucae TaxID=4779 RepID=A0A976IIA8_BRELC|nr:hypothetical protein CCR75_004884 [Bremia lactucae]